MGSTVKDRAFVAYIAEAQTWARPFSRARKLCVGYAPWATFAEIERALIARGIPAERAADTPTACATLPNPESWTGCWS